MSSQELEFKDGNPGAVQYGNFINYYQFHPPDNRINLLPRDIWLPKITRNALNPAFIIPNDNRSTDNTKGTFLALDIGCNAGNLTHELLKFLQNMLPNCMELQMLAVDIDPVLIQRAKEEYPLKNIKFMHSDCTQETFAASCQQFLQNFNKNMFDAIFCFSTIMWIHLNKGDQGLTTFLRDISKLGRLVIIEPQPWKCYKSAVKRMKGKIVFEYFKSLKMTEDVEQDIENVLIDDLNMHKVFESDISHWKRKIYCFEQGNLG